MWTGTAAAPRLSCSEERADGMAAEGSVLQTRGLRSLAALRRSDTLVPLTP